MKHDYSTLPISEEMIEAYFEGNLTHAEETHVRQLIESDPLLREHIQLVDEITLSIDENVSIYDDYPDFDKNFKLPHISIAHDEGEGIDIEAVDIDDVLDEDVQGDDDDYLCDVDVVDDFFDF